MGAAASVNGGGGGGGRGEDVFGGRRSSGSSGSTTTAIKRSRPWTVSDLEEDESGLVETFSTNMRDIDIPMAILNVSEWRRRRRRRRRRRSGSGNSR